MTVTATARRRPLRDAAIRLLVPRLLRVRRARAGGASPMRILILRTDVRLGNLVTVTSLFEPLRRAFPEARLDVLCAPALAPLLAPDPLVHAVRPLHRARLWLDPLYALATVARLRRARYDVAIDASHAHAFSSTEAILLRATGAPRRIGFDRGPEASCASDLVAPPAADDRRARPDVYCDLLRPLGVGPRAGDEDDADAEPEAAAARVVAADRAATAGGAFIAEVTGRADGAAVVVHVGGRGAKRWPIERFLEVARRLEEEGARVVLVGGPGERAALRAAASRTAPEAEGGAWRPRVAPVLDLAAFVGLVANADLFVGCDAGPTHVAAGLGVPRVTAFLEDRAWEWAHGAGQIALYAEGGPSVDDVVEAARTLLPSASTSRTDVVVETAAASVGVETTPQAPGPARARVLVLQFRRIGDVILTTPLLATLRAARPDWHVTVLVDEGCHEPLVGHPAVDELLVIPQSAWTEPVRTARAFAAVRGVEADVAIDVLSTPLSAVVARVSGAAQRIGFSLRQRPFYTTAVPRSALPVYTAIARQVLLEPLEIAPSSTTPALAPDFARTEWAREALSRARDGRTIVALSPTSRRPARRWPLAAWGTLGRALAADGARVLALWAPDERAWAEEVARASGGAIEVAPATPDLRSLAGILAASSLLVAVDNGARHLAVALGVPTVGLFGPTDPATCTPPAPAGDIHATLRGPACVCADRRRCEAPACMRGLSVDAVLERVRARLAEATPPAEVGA